MRERRDKYIPEIGADDNFEPALVHPDITYATRTYDGSKISFQHCMELRNEALANGDTYWVNYWDEQMTETARERTEVAAAMGWVYPGVKKR